MSKDILITTVINKDKKMTQNIEFIENGKNEKWFSEDQAIEILNRDRNGQPLTNPK